MDEENKERDDFLRKILLKKNLSLKFLFWDEFVLF